MEDKKKGFHIKWPWDIVLYIVLLAVLRVFAIPVIIFLVSQNRKSAPSGPNDGYCMRQAHARMSMLLWALLYFAIAVCLGVFGYVTMTETQSYRETQDLVKLIVAGLGAVVFAALGLYSLFVGLRDSLFPEKGALARSIRAQIARPEDYANVGELFEVVDKDIEENGTWFGNIAAGNEWVLGPTANLISRIRAVFYRNEIRTRSAGQRMTTTRIIQLIIMDDEQRSTIYDMKDPDDLHDIVSYLSVKAPDAVYKHYDEYVNYNSMKPDEWEEFLLDYRRRAAARQA